MNRWVLLGLGLVVMVGSASSWARARQGNSSLTAAERLQSELEGIRLQIDDCLTGREDLELELEAMGAQAERLRHTIDSLEGLDPRGVPASDYDSYMTLVDEYNETIPDWEERSDGLLGLASRCDSLVRDHNAQARSLQEFLVGEGIWDESWLEP